MLTSISPKLPMRSIEITKEFYENQLGFYVFGLQGLDDYLMMERDQVQIHFFLHKNLDFRKNDGQAYIRVDGIDQFYQSLLDNKTPIHPNGELEVKSWGQKEFSVLDPDHNLITFGEGV